MRLRVLRKYINGILSFGLNTDKINSDKSSKLNAINSNENIRKYYEDKWNKYFQSEGKVGKEFVLDKGDWISDSNGIFGLGEGFSAKGEIQCSDKNRKFIINLNGNSIGHKRSDVSYNSRIINVLDSSKCEIKNGRLQAKKVLDKGAAICVEMNGFLHCNMCMFEDNHTSCSGGAIYGCEFSNIKLNKCQFKNNSASGFGGAIFVGSDAIFESVDSEFVDNKSKFAQGGAVYFKANSENLLFKNCTFVKNKSEDNGKSIFVGDKNKLFCFNCDFAHDGYDENSDQLVYAHDLAIVKLSGCNIIDNKLLQNKCAYNHLKS